MVTCTGHFTAGGSIKFRSNRLVWVHNNRRRRTCHLTAGEAIKLIVNRRMGIHNNRRRHSTIVDFEVPERSRAIYGRLHLRRIVCRFRFNSNAQSSFPFLF
ncbi:hypothetical protein TNCV_640721 [Trichonephila clavipes]|nr:hypothetical protein TNCV_640721 [Trichonephila clavipes]